MIVLFLSQQDVYEIPAEEEAPAPPKPPPGRRGLPPTPKESQARLVCLLLSPAYVSKTYSPLGVVAFVCLSVHLSIYRIYPAIRRGFCPSRMTSNN